MVPCPAVVMVLVLVLLLAALVCHTAGTHTHTHTHVSLSLSQVLQQMATDVFTVGPSLAGLPAISVPTTLSDRKMPIGMQVVSKVCHLSFFSKTNNNV